jgi:hypothetical protein
MARVASGTIAASITQLFFFFVQRASTAFRPCSLSSCLVSLAALALPPFFPKATACGFFFPIQTLYYVTLRKMSCIIRSAM